MHQELVQKCNEYMESKNITQVKLASKIGIGESTFSRWLKNTYPNPDSINEKVSIFFEKEEARNNTTNVTDIDFAKTSVSQRVMTVLEYCRIQKTIGCIYGDAGIGKTYTTKEWAKDKQDVITITINPTFSSPKPFLKLLAKELKTTRTGGIDDIMIEIIEKLETADRTIIIDEAQHLTRKTLEIVRSINDATGTAIILIGNETVYSKMLGKQQAEFAQLFSRLGIRDHILTDSFKTNDVFMVFNESDKSIINYLLKICRSKYGLRGAIFVYTNSQNNSDISLEGLQAMASMMGINV